MYVMVEAGFYFHLYRRYRIKFRPMGRDQAYVYDVNQPAYSH